VHLTILTPYPGTAIYAQGLESGVIAKDVWREFAAHPHMGFVPPHWGENFSLPELEELLVEGYRSFYRRPRYLIKRVLTVRSGEELVRKARAGVRILTMRGRSDRGRTFP
jgi:anaerobic magnesium-protoporphyrin IX monomethyl ester cyclase